MGGYKDQYVSLNMTVSNLCSSCLHDTPSSSLSHLSMSPILALILQHSYVVSYRLVLKTIVSVVNLHVVSGWIEWFEHA